MNLKEFLEKITIGNNFEYSVLVNNEGVKIEEFGQPNPKYINDPYNLYLLNADVIKNTFKFLEGQLTPQFISQGTRNLIIFKPSPTLVLSCIYDDDRSFIDTIEVSEHLNLEINEYINKLFPNTNV